MIIMLFEIKSSRETTMGVDTEININIYIHYNRTENELRLLRLTERFLYDYTMVFGVK